MTDINKYIELKVKIREATDKILGEAGLTMKQFIDLEEDCEAQVPDCYTTELRGYDISVEAVPNYLWKVIEERAGYQVCQRHDFGFTNRIKIHKRRSK